LAITTIFVCIPDQSPILFIKKSNLISVVIIIIILFESGNKAHKHTNKRHTDRQIDSISKRNEKCNTRCTIKHSKLIELL